MMVGQHREWAEARSASRSKMRVFVAEARSRHPTNKESMTRRVRLGTPYLGSDEVGWLECVHDVAIGGWSGGPGSLQGLAAGADMACRMRVIRRARPATGAKAQPHGAEPAAGGYGDARGKAGDECRHATHGAEPAAGGYGDARGKAGDESRHATHGAEPAAGGYGDARGKAGDESRHATHGAKPAAGTATRGIKPAARVDSGARGKASGGRVQATRGARPATGADAQHVGQSQRRECRQRAGKADNSRCGVQAAHRAKPAVGGCKQCVGRCGVQTAHGAKTSSGMARVARGRRHVAGWRVRHDGDKEVALGGGGRVGSGRKMNQR
ncbi:hypothetical protein EDB85DRAFT_548267 [Lactarius pseudohatsudake]|nr:hypothetical protein EDB85DRAFT_548267 [Lactarius pseudohatsudake]